MMCGPSRGSRVVPHVGRPSKKPPVVNNTWRCGALKARDDADTGAGAGAGAALGDDDDDRGDDDGADGGTGRPAMRELIRRWDSILHFSSMPGREVWLYLGRWKWGCTV